MNLKQLKDLLGMFKKRLSRNDLVYAIEVAVSDQEVKQRLGKRRMCACGKVYHLAYNPPINQGLCDICGKKLFTRNDDKPKVVFHRLKIYHKQGEPVLGYWKKQVKLIAINGEQPIAKIHNDIMEKLKELRLV